MSKVKKRDGSLVDFDGSKIINALAKAYTETGKAMDTAKWELFVEQNFPDDDDTVYLIEDIQDEVQKKLIEVDYEVGLAFVLYRNKRKTDRELANEQFDFVKTYIKASNTANATVDDNSNVGNKNVGVLNAEIHKRRNINSNREWERRKLRELFPDSGLDKQYVTDLLSRVFYKNDENSFPFPVPYCVAASMYPFLLHGLELLGGKSTKPKNLDSFCGMYINLVFALSGMFAGAVALPETLLCFDWYARKEWGEDYYLNADKTITANWVKRQLTVKQQIHQYFEQIVHSINQPSGARGQQSAFVNFSIFDKPFFDGMFGNFYFPDETQPKWESVQWLQECFMEWFNAERLRTILTFPVVSVTMLVDKETGAPVDTRMEEFACKQWAEGDSFFVYLSDSVDSLSSCCFDGDTKVLWKSSTTGVKLTTLKELHEMRTDDKKNFRVFHNGSWVEGKSIKLPNRDMFKVVTENGKEFVMTDNHINVTLKGEKPTSELTTDDYLLFNTQVLNAVPENDEHLTYAEGFVIGMFLGDGSFGTRTEYGIYDTNFSLSDKKYEVANAQLIQALKDLHIDAEVRLSQVYNNVYPVRICSKELVAFIQKWTNWTEGTKAETKEINLNCLLQSEGFRNGILDGWYHTDGGNANRCYTTSKALAESMEALITSLGRQSRIDVSDRNEEPVVIRGKEYKRNFPLYCVRWYKDTNNRCNKDQNKSWIKLNNGLYFKVKSIEQIAHEDNVYCIECKNQNEPYFTLPSGLITHNCRLKNKIQTKEFNFTNGNIGVETGSKSVISMNLSRIMQNFFREVIGDKDAVVKDRIAIIRERWSDYQQYIGAILERIYKYHIAYNENLFDIYNAKLLPAYEAGFIDLNKQYLTIGLNGLNQSAEFLGMSCSDNDDYKWYCENLFSTIKEMNSAHNGKFNGHKLTFNTEQVPAESLAVKNYNWDKEDGYWVPTDTNLYASYVYKPNDVNVQILEKIRMHGDRFIGDYLDGGSAAHLNLDAHLSKVQYRYLLRYAIANGCSYMTFNVPNSECQECGYITKHPIKECPKCGSKKIDYYDRVIGYLTKVANWSEGRQIEQGLRIYEGVSKEDIGK